MKLSEINLNLRILKDGEIENFIKLDEGEKLDKSIIFADIEVSKEVLEEKNVSAVICKEENVKYYMDLEVGIISSPTPKDDFFKIMNFLSKNTNFYYKGQMGIISPNAKIAKNVFIDEKDVIIEDGVTIESGSVIKSGSIIKKGCYIGPNCIIGAESFSYFGREKGKVLSSKKVIIQESVNLLGGNLVEKGVHRDTVVGKNTKVAVGAIIEHDTIVEEENMICAGAVIAGRVKVEKNCYIGPNSTIRNNIVLGKKTIVSMGAVVTQSTVGDERVTGNFAINHEEFIEKIKN